MDKYILILSEKPSAALKIAEALADKSPKKQVYLKKIPYYELTHKGEKTVLGSPNVLQNKGKIIISRDWLRW